MKATITKTQDAPRVGTYCSTTKDEIKVNADFLLLQTSPNVIRWRMGLMGGKTETVSDKNLRLIQSSHPNWATDF